MFCICMFFPSPVVVSGSSTRNCRRHQKVEIKGDPGQKRLSLALIILKWQLVKWREFWGLKWMSVCMCVCVLKSIILQITPLDNLSLSASLNNTKATWGENIVTIRSLIILSACNLSCLFFCLLSVKSSGQMEHIGPLQNFVIMWHIEGKSLCIVRKSILTVWFTRWLIGVDAFYGNLAVEHVG